MFLSPYMTKQKVVSCVHKNGTSDVKMDHTNFPFCCFLKFCHLFNIYLRLNETYLTERLSTKEAQFRTHLLTLFPGPDASGNEN